MSSRWRVRRPPALSAPPTRAARARPAQVFKPERWLPGGANGARPTMLSFHHGPFTCLGMTLYILEAKVGGSGGGRRRTAALFEGLLPPAAHGRERLLLPAARPHPAPSGSPGPRRRPAPAAAARKPPHNPPAVTALTLKCPVPLAPPLPGLAPGAGGHPRPRL
jgi:hypothetical protein